MEDSDKISKNRLIAPWLEEPLSTLELAHQRQRLGHAILIAGPPGVGKRVLARALSRTLIDESGHLSDGHPDFHWVEPAEGKVNVSVDQIRGVCGQLALTSHAGGSKVAIVFPAEAMTLSAANALLKTLEEPTSRTYLLLISHQPGRLPATIRSRCQTYAIASPSLAQAVGWLNEQAPGKASDWPSLLRYGGGPFAALELADREFDKFNSELQSEMKAISIGESDPVKVAQRWVKGDVLQCLDWLGRELKAMIKNLARGNEITDWGRATLHNMASNSRMRILIERADRLDRLRGLVGGGVNTEMALRALLIEFSPVTAGHSQ